MTRRALLKVIAFAAWFFLVLRCGSGDPDDSKEKTIQRVVVATVLLSGLIVAVVGIIELFTWNGKILWMFEPYDWEGSPAAIARASGPFVNPDHFGAYLAMVLPLAVVGAGFDVGLFPARFGVAFRLLCAATAFLITAGLLLSGSRGAWIGATLGLALVISLSGRISADTRSAVAGGYRRLVGAGLVFLTVIVLALVFVGPVGTAAVSSRVQGATHVDTTRLRLTIDSLRMVHDRPAFGVGLAAWPEIFPQYRTPPWPVEFFREAHDDYVQLLTETGFAGFVTIFWFLAAAIGLIRQGFTRNSRGRLPLLIGLCGSLAALASHEFIDFNLQTPANALLAILLLALAIRLAGKGQYRRVDTGNHVRFYAAGMIVIAIALISCALAQNKIPYPYGPALTTPAEAIEAIRAHPAESTPHAMLSMLLGNEVPFGRRLNELRVAVWLDPFDPYVHDHYAAVLLERGDKAQGLKTLTQSVEYSPSFAHHYLRDRYIHKLSAEEASAIEEGFRRARAEGYDGAAVGLATYYSDRGRYTDAAAAFLDAARQEHESNLKLVCLLNAGTAYTKAQRLDDAGAAFRQAIAVDPSDTDAYGLLIGEVLGPEHRLEGATMLVSQGIEAGADPDFLYGALANASYAAHNLSLAERSLASAIAARPQYSVLLQLGQLYIEDKKYERAISVLNQAIDDRPDSGEAHFGLGLAEEGDYNFAAAQNEYAHAISLDPKNSSYQDYYSQFKQRLTQDTKTQSDQ